MVCKDAHISRLGGDVDLDTVDCKIQSARTLIPYLARFAAKTYTSVDLYMLYSANVSAIKLPVA
jgi:hypothetical protein